MTVAEIGLSPVYRLVISVCHVLSMGVSLSLSQLWVERLPVSVSLVTLQYHPPVVLQATQYMCLVCARPLFDVQHWGVGENEKMNK